MSYALGIVGAGNMAEAIVRGAIQTGLFVPSAIIAADVSPVRRELFQKQLMVRAVASSADAVRDAQVVLLSVKPQQMADVLSELGRVMSPQSLVISIAAGISSGFVEAGLGTENEWRVVRVMPNTPLLVGAGMVALARGRHATEQDLTVARRLFGFGPGVAASSGQVVELPETLMDAVTAVSGSGPAYFFYLAEQMIQAGIELGLRPEHARQLTAQTALGAAKMLIELSETPQELRRKVTSPGGTTHAAITYLESRGFGPALAEAVKAAAKRSKELGR